MSPISQSPPSARQSGTIGTIESGVATFFSKLKSADSGLSYRLLFLVSVISLFWSGSAFAQLAPDDASGAARSEVPPDGEGDEASEAQEREEAATDEGDDGAIDEGSESPDGGENAAIEADAASVQVILFVDQDPIEGAEVLLVTGSDSSQQTDAVGSAKLSESKSGQVELRARVPREKLVDAPPGEGPVEVKLETIELVLGETVEVIATLAPDGTVESVDVQSVAGSVQEARAAEALAADADVPTGTVSGKVLDSENQSPVEGARVFVRGSSAEATTDPAGSFEIELPEGSWAISVIHPDYTTVTEPDVLVKAEESGDVTFELLPASTVLEDFVITVPHVEGSVASVLSERRESASMSDAISAEDISKSGAGDAAGAAQRVVGVTIVDGKFVYVRGLGERYTNALLNGSPMPSPEPDKATVPLDLLPTQVIRSIDIAKTSTPDFPADFAGGSVRIETITVPEEPIFGISLKAGYNTQSTFRERAAFQRSRTDIFGFDSGMRAMPESAPDYVVRRGAEKPDGERVLDDEIRTIGRDFNSVMVPKNTRNWPNLGGSVIAGRGWDLAKDLKLGTLASFTYSREQSLQEEIIRTFNSAGQGEPARVWVDGRSTSATDSVQWGAFGSLALEYKEQHKLSLIGLRSQIADDNTRLLDLFKANNESNYITIRNGYTSRSLEFAQLRGQHCFPILYDGELDWRATLGRAQLDRPDLRDTIYFKPRGGDTWAFSAGSDSGRHFFAEMVERAKSLYGDWTQPIVKGELEKKLKFGGGANSKARVFQARRFTFSARGADTVCGMEFDYSCPEDLFTNSNLQDGVITFEENTQPTDAYQARSDVYAGYAMLDFKLLKPLRVIGGARMEATDQVVSGYNQYDPSDREGIEDIEFNTTNWLPSASVVYTAAEWIEFRAAASKTVARPQLREIAPFQFQDYFGGATVNGNPDLRLTRITNADLRVDVYPSPAEVISLSTFVKDFVDPIEPNLLPSNGDPIQTFQNARGAFLYGAEVEARKNLEFLSDSLEYFGVMGNLTLAKSKIRLEQTGGSENGVGFITTTERPMVNQAPYVVNLALDFEIPDETQARLLYNVSGRQIVAIGTEGLPDQYQQSFHSLDFTFSQRIAENWRLGASVKNILNSRVMVTQGKDRDEDAITLAYRKGVSFGLKVGYSL